MAAMDLRTNQEVMGMQSRYSSEYGSHMFKGTETFQEADIKGNNNIFNSLKTEANHDCSHNSSSLYQGKCSNKQKLEVDNSLFSYSSFKKAMDLRTHNRTLDGGKRTIFDDAEYFAKTHCYKLLPITFEQVDETIIQSEHNYSLFSLTSESEAEEDCSRMMDYTQIKEKNYKRRRTKNREGSEKEEFLECGTIGGDENCTSYSSPVLCDGNESVIEGAEPLSASLDLEPENLAEVQPLDLSASPSADGEKTDFSLRERRDNSAEKSEEIARLDSDKENLNLELSGIRVTITRPDEKENYQPCDLFLNDIARLVPWLIDKDCLEVDILDRTCDGDEFRKHRLYYVISESTWRLFQTSNERVILTNDRSLGPPLNKAEKGERPSFLVFDQFSLAKCLAEYCQEIGGCFEYTCVEEGKEEDCSEEKNAGEVDREMVKETAITDVKEVVEEGGESLEVKEYLGVVGEKSENLERYVKAIQNVGEDAERKTEEEAVKEERTMSTNEVPSKETEEPETEKESEKVDVSVEGPVEDVLSGNRGLAEIPAKETQVHQQTRQPVAKLKNGKEKEEKKNGKVTNPKRTPPIQPIPKNNGITTRSKSTSDSETSQKSDERVKEKEKRKRGGSALPKVEPPTKLKKPVNSEDLPRMTRSGKVLEEGRTNKGTAVTRQRRRTTQGELPGEAKTFGGAAEGTGRSLRSQKAAQGKEEGRGSGRGQGQGITTRTKGGRR